MNFSSVVTDNENGFHWLVNIGTRDKLTPSLFMDAFPALKEEIVLPPKKKKCFSFSFPSRYFISNACEWLNAGESDNTGELYENLLFEWTSSSVFNYHSNPTYLSINWNSDFQLNSLEVETQDLYNRIERWISKKTGTIFSPEDCLEQFNENIQHIHRSIAGILNRVRAMRKALSSFLNLKLDIRLTIRKKTCVVFKVLDDEHIIKRSFITTCNSDKYINSIY